MDWVQVATVVGTLVTALGGAAGVRALFRRRPPRIDGAVALNQSTLDWAAKLEASADRAWERAEQAEQKANAADERADEAERKAEAAVRRMNALGGRLDQMNGYLSFLFRNINDPSMTIDRLRVIVGSQPPHLHEGTTTDEPRPHS